MSLSTPINISFYDNPKGNLEFLQSLSIPDMHIYVLGYIQACHHMQDTLGDSKRRFLTAALERDEDEQDRLLTYVKLMDSFDSSLQRRVVFLEETWPVGI